MNELATNLFKYLIECGYDYLVKVTSKSITFDINDHVYTINYMKKKPKEYKPIRFEESTGMFCISSYSIYDCSTENVKDEDKEFVFVLSIGNTSYDITFSRIETAKYLDKIDNLINKYNEDLIKGAINVIENNLSID